MGQAPTYRLSAVVKAKQDGREDFSGPLDLILALLAKNKIEIRDIKIAVILEQYLEYLDEMKQMDLEVASEFVVMASHLMHLKTKMLLTADDEQALSELELLMQSLEQRRCAEIYASIREAAQELAVLSEIGRSMFVKMPEPLGKAREYSYEHESRDLLLAMNDISERSKNALPPPISAFEEIVEQTPFPVARKASEVVRRLITVGKSALNALFQGSHSRSEIVATFVAVLELMRSGVLRVTQEKGEEKVSYVGDGSADS